MYDEFGRRNRTGIIKKIAIVVMVLLLILPTLFCVFLMTKVNNLESEVAQYREAVQISIAKADEAVPAGSEIKAEEVPADREDVADKEDESSTDDDDTKQEAGKEAKRVYLTFDDGPSKYTSRLLDIFARYEVKATFFINGKTSDTDKELIKRMYDEGHTVGMHSFSHDYEKVYKSVKAFEEDYDRISGLIEEVTGEKPKYYRFPGGSSNTVSDIDIQKFIAVLDKKNAVYVDWNAANMDATGTSYTVDELIDNVLEAVEKNNTSVVLMHDTGSKKSTVDSIPRLIRELKSRGYVLLAIDENTPLIQHVSSENTNKNSNNG